MVSLKSILKKAGFPKRSINNLKATQLVPGNNILAANLMARTWNSATEIQPSRLSLPLPLLANMDLDTVFP